MQQNSFNLQSAKFAIASISVYRKVVEDELINKVKVLLNAIYDDQIGLDNVISLYNEFFFDLASNGTGSFENHIIDKIIFDENPFSIRAQEDNKDERTVLIEKAAANDLQSLQIISKLNSEIIKQELLNNYIHNDFELSVIDRLPEWGTTKEYVEDAPDYIIELKNIFKQSSNWDQCLEELKQFHRNYGCGVFSNYKAFVWQNHNLQGAANPDPISLRELIGYNDERSLIVENTQQFLKGGRANNALLYGDRGTGKSSTVKALLNEYFPKGLRLIEVSKASLFDLPTIIRGLKTRPQKFIIFIDDLVFAEDDESYNALKAILEGGIESKPANVLIYATSNRRHLVKEYFHERNGFNPSSNNNEEIHAGDSIQEKLSLADRFGITVVFSSPDKKRYLEIVDGIVANRKIKIDTEKLHSEALKWELWYNGRSPRTARQFVDWLEGQEEMLDR